MKLYVKSFGKKVFIFLILVVSCTILKILACALPSDVIQKNIANSRIMIESTGIYPTLPGLNNTYEWEESSWNKGDYYTEWMMVNVAYNVDSKHPFESAMLNTRVTWDPSNSAGSLLYAIDNLDTSEVQNYAIQYWLGSVSIIRLLLYFYDYSQVITFFQVIFWVIFGVSLLCVLKRTKNLLIPLAYILSFVCVSAITASFSFTYGITFIISFIAIIIISTYSYNLNQTYTGFLIIGSLTAYFDWLSTPSITCTLPLAIAIIETSQQDNHFEIKIFLRRLFNIILCGINWCFGYAFMLSSKWIISGIVTKESVIDIVKERVLSDVGTYIEDKPSYYLETLSYYLKMLITYKLQINWIWLLLGGLIIIGLGICIFRKKNFSLYIELFIVAIIPFAWPIVLMWHSHEHYWFTYRNLIVTIFIVFFMSFRSISIISEKLKIKICNK